MPRGVSRCDRPREGYDDAMTPQDPDPIVQHEAQVTIQDIVDRLAATGRGEDPDAIRAALAQAIADAGLPEQPEKWVRDTATEVVAGRQVVIDRTRRDEDDPRR